MGTFDRSDRPGSDPDIRRVPTPHDNDPDRLDSEMVRIWKHINALEQDYERGERLLTGLSYAVFGLDQVKGSGLVNQVEIRLGHVERKLDQANRAMWGLIATGVIAVLTQIVIKVAS